MIDEEFFMSLPPDPEEAFPIYRRHVREQCFPEGWQQDRTWDCERDYIHLMIAFIDHYQLDLDLTLKVPTDDSEFASYYEHARRVIDQAVARFALKRLDRMKSGVTGVYVLTPALKQEIHHYIGRIRETMNKISLPDVKREALFNKLTRKIH